MKTIEAAAQPGYRTRRIFGRAQQGQVPDPYRHQRKLPDGTHCPQCHAGYYDGRWQWAPPAAPAHEELCPACRRVNDRLPAGTLTLRGAFVQAHKDELVGLVRHQEAAEAAEHPMNRIIDITEDEAGLVIDTTDIHLPRRIGEALKHAYRGELDMHFDDAAYFVRVYWHPPS